MVSVVQIGVDHELAHRANKFHFLLGALDSIKGFNTHLAYDHVHGHHRYVATPEDATTSHFGQSFYTFAPKAFKQMWVNVYKREKSLGKPFFLNFAFLTVVFYAAATYAVRMQYSWFTAFLFFFQATFCHFYAIAINYVQHYGLMRQKLPNGEYERVRRWHSWDAPHRFSNYLFLKQERHSDHHENCLKPYQTLSAS